MNVIQQSWNEQMSATGVSGWMHVMLVYGMTAFLVMKEFRSKKYVLQLNLMLAHCI